jgi:hypothetical protein
MQHHAGERIEFATPRRAIENLSGVRVAGRENSDN